MRKGHISTLHLWWARRPQVACRAAESATEKGLGFDPAAFSKAGNATCPLCGTVADNDYVKAEGCARRMGRQMMGILCTRPGEQRKVYLSADGYPQFWPDDAVIRKRIEVLCKRTGLTVASEPMPKPGSLGFRVQPSGIRTWGELFNPLVAQTPAGTALEGGGGDGRGAAVSTTAAEQAALKKRVANWRALIEQRTALPLFESLGEA